MFYEVIAARKCVHTRLEEKRPTARKTRKAPSVGRNKTTAVKIWRCLTLLKKEVSRKVIGNREKNEIKIAFEGR